MTSNFLLTIFHSAEHGGDFIGMLPHPDGVVIVFPDGFALTVLDPVMVKELKPYFELFKTTDALQDDIPHPVHPIPQEDIRYAITHVSAPVAGKVLDAAASVRYHRTRQARASGPEKTAR